MAKPIYLIGGCKGGVGKSLVTMAVADYLHARGEDPLLIEADTSNPDVWRMYENTLTGALIDLDEADGWIELVNTCAGEPERIVLINTAARNNKGASAYGEVLNSTLTELERRLVTLWVINRQRDSLELLRDYLAALPEALIHVVRNRYFGQASQFELYNGSHLKTQIEARGGRSLTFPDLADRVADDLYTQRLTIAAAVQALPLGNRAELLRWRRAVGMMLSGVLDE